MITMDPLQKSVFEYVRGLSPAEFDAYYMQAFGNYATVAHAELYDGELFVGYALYDTNDHHMIGVIDVSHLSQIQVQYADIGQ